MLNNVGWKELWENEPNQARLDYKFTQVAFKIRVLSSQVLGNSKGGDSMAFYEIYCACNCHSCDFYFYFFLLSQSMA